MPDEPWSADEERPLTARSVIASTLLGVSPPRLPTGLLVRSCGLFGIADGTARVAMSRMVAAGELVAEDGAHTLSGPLLARQQRQDISRRAATEPWTPADGDWITVVVTAEGRSPADRARLRAAARAARLASLRDGVWLRPDNLGPTGPGAVDEQGRELNGSGPWEELRRQGELLRSRPEGDPAALAGRLWDLEGWATRAKRLLAALERTRPALDAGDRAALPEGFVLSAAVLRLLQADPLLPPALWPARWPGSDLRATHDAWDAAFGQVWADWYRSARGG